MADRKQGAGVSSGSSAAVHKAHSCPKAQRTHFPGLSLKENIPGKTGTGGNLNDVWDNQCNWGTHPGSIRSTKSPMWFQTKIVYQRQFRAENMLAVHQDAALFILEQHNIPTRQILAY